MLVKMKKYRQFTPKRDFGSTFTKKVDENRDIDKYFKMWLYWNNSKID